jgi:hypothetical protein
MFYLSLSCTDGQFLRYNINVTASRTSIVTAIEAGYNRYEGIEVVVDLAFS